MFDRLTEHRPVTIVAIVQILLVVMGWMLTTGHLKLQGYPDPPSIFFEWNPWSVWVRDWGLWLLLLPPAWVVMVLYLDARETLDLPPLVLIGTGLLFVLLLAFFFWRTASEVMFHRIFVPS